MGYLCTRYNFTKRNKIEKNFRVKQKIIENYIDAYNSFDIDRMLSDIHKDIKFDADQVEVGVDYSGILAVDLSNDLKIEDIIELKGNSIFRFKDDKIVELNDIS